MTKLNIKKYLNKNKKSTAYNKTYARVAYLETLGTNDLCRHIQKHGSIFTSDVVKGVVEKFVNCFNELLLEGYKIKLDGLGTFYLSISTTGEADPDEFSVRNVKAVRIKFLGDKSKESEYTTQMLTQRASFRNLPADNGSSESSSPGNLAPAPSPNGEGSENQGGGETPETPGGNTSGNTGGNDAGENGSGD